MLTRDEMEIIAEIVVRWPITITEEDDGLRFSWIVQNEADPVGTEKSFVIDGHETNRSRNDFAQLVMQRIPSEPFRKV